MPKIIVGIIAIALVGMAGGFWLYQSISAARGMTDAEAESCEIDSDCVVFGEDGDCNCGCFNKNYEWEKTSDCFCAAPKLCRCINGKCEAVFGEINSFDDCAAAGYLVMESYPRQCRIPGREAFIEDIGNELEKIDIIRIDSPRPNQVISSPLIIQGEARGTWFFEGDFPVYLLDDNGKELKIGIARAESDWMTEDFVPFEAKIEFQQPKTKPGILVFKKDNPSGLPEHDDELRMPVRF